MHLESLLPSGAMGSQCAMQACVALRALLMQHVPSLARRTVQYMPFQAQCMNCQRMRALPHSRWCGLQRLCSGFLAALPTSLLCGSASFPERLVNQTREGDNMFALRCGV